MLAAALFALSILAHSPASSSVEVSKKQAYLDSKRGAAPLRAVPRAGARADRVVFARNLHTREVLPLATAAGERSDRFFRCWFTGESADMPDELVEIVLAAAEHFDARKVRIVSGYRHPKYNLLLRKKGREVARKSQHTQGNAIDFSLAGITAEDLYRHLLAHHKGGVGYYPRSGFVHVDLGRKRTWRGS